MAKRNEYSIIAFTGRVNVGKSSLLNLLSGQDNYAIVDAKPGTTADVVSTRMEIHGLGSIKVLDTAGLDEYSELGEKKRKKTYEAVEEADLVIIVINLLKNSKNDDFSLEREIAKKAFKYDKQVFILYNIFPGAKSDAEIKSLENSTNEKLNLEIPSLCVNALDKHKQKKLIDFINANFKKEKRNINLIPISGGKGYVILNIPMDEETPELRLLRPQDMVVERLLRKQLIPVLYRMDLKKARDNDEKEHRRFLEIIEFLSDSKEGLKLVITDSQAIDILAEWTPKNIPLTTFSITMANYMSYGNLKLFIKGLDIIPLLKTGDKILIAESCNHNRKCDDIGTSQIPRLIKKKLGIDLNIDFCFGRVFNENLKQYKLVIHCGGCMIDRQKYGRRVMKLKEAGVPITNYGLFLSWIHNPEIIRRVAKIFIN